MNISISSSVSDSSCSSTSLGIPVPVPRLPSLAEASSGKGRSTYVNGGLTGRMNIACTQVVRMMT